jgi:uncharacterized damage-inducible protein DinB
MTIAETLLPEFDRETTTTRKLLERLPEDKFEWKPHAKSMSLGQLAAHVATIPMWGSVTVSQPEFDLATNPPRPPMATRAEILAAFDRFVRETRAALVGRSDPELMAPWALRNGKETVFSMPKVAVWRSFVMSHLIHHRGQLSVYLRMQDVALPGIYGPSADEPAF